jgi:3-methyladenine DNA glycosylase Mpg
MDLLGGGDVRLFRTGAPEQEIAVSPRIGIDYAGDAKHWPLRFFDSHSFAVSGRRANR